MLRSLLVDFNSYFASVEQQEQPQLRGKPVAVVPVQADSTCCIAASYEAKAFGIKTGTRVADARRLCAQTIFVEARHELYVRYHEHAIALIDSVAPIRRVLSIDEAECLLTGRWQEKTQAEMLAQKIKQRLREALGECMRVSIGIAANTLLAKLASNMKKPDGLVVLTESDLPQAILHLPPHAINGIGPRLWQRLQAAGLDTMAKLYAAPRTQLRVVWGGVAGADFHDALHGQWQEIAAPTPRSISHSHVLPPQIRHTQGARDVLSRLTQKAAMRLRHMRCYASALNVFISSALPSGRTWGKQKPWARHCRFAQTDDTVFLLHSLEALYGEDIPAHPVAVGIVLSGLVPTMQHSLSLFDEVPVSPIARTESTAKAQTALAATDTPVATDSVLTISARRAQLLRAVDAINRTYGKNTIYFASGKGGLAHAPMRIAFNHIPDIEREQ